MHEARRWFVRGKVQGVGFRPFVYNLAKEHALSGWVKNKVGQVEIRAEGLPKELDQFAQDLIQRKPDISEPEIYHAEQVDIEVFQDFEILPSESGEDVDIHVPPDYFICEDCLAEMQDPNNRRYQYPFTNCTQCGPRYTLIESLPYDRPNTSMADFPLCEDCQKEYEDPKNRRFHAEPIACPVCGPQLQYKDAHQIINDSTASLEACIDAFEQGEIVAVKGIGGYHLMCDATNDDAVQTLRERKHRPDKPLAVMFPASGEDELGQIKQAVELTEAEATLLRSPARPIVLAKKQANSGLSKHIAKGLNELGVMLAYSPMHHLLLNTFGKPIVATSANLSGEPVLIDEQVVETRLSHITTNFLHHNRPIVRPADDSVYRSIDQKPRPIRLGRGQAPIEIQLPFSLQQPVLACGSHMKNTVALAWGDRLVVSPHIGDLDSPRSLEVFEQSIEDLQHLYQIKAEIIACDAHPAYASTRWSTKYADEHQLALHKIQHHQAHASATFLECWQEENVLMFAWDGTGMGNDGSLWGGEAFYGQPGNWQRVASMRPFHLPGGEKAGREPWRSAASLFWENQQDWNDVPEDANLLKMAWQKGINSPKSSAVGRLFDATAAMTGVAKTASFEGQAPMLLETLCGELNKTDPYPIEKNADHIWLADWSLLLLDMQREDLSSKQKASLFHARMAHTLIKQAELIREEYPFTTIGLSGGVFQNKRLTDYVAQQLRQSGYQVCIPEKLPVNDATISCGQIVETMAMIK